MKTLAKWLFPAFLLIYSPFLRAQEFIGPHGFLTLEAEWGDRDETARRGTFDLHHFNIFGDFLLTSTARIFAEIEFEHGADLESEEYNNNTAGFVRLERAWFEYRFSPLFILRVGKYLTPFGIYNELHDAAPAYDTTVLPTSIYGKHRTPQQRLQRFYAKFSIGMHLLGRISSDNFSLKYQLFLTNGRGKSPFEQDDNRNKGLGMRLIGEWGQNGPKLGFSVYSDRNGLDADARQTAIAVDWRHEIGRLRLTGEFARFLLERVPGGDSRIAHGGYGEVGVNVFRKQTFIARYDLFNPDIRAGGDLEKDLTLGTSIRFIDQAVTKFEVHFWNIENGSPDRFVQILASLAVIF